MDALINLFETLLHADAYLMDLVRLHGNWVYAILFTIVFCETGLVVTPFLPGDALLFAVGTLVALGALAPAPTLILLVTAAVAGDAANYAIGRIAGERAYHSRFVRQAYLKRTEEFFDRHGGQTILIARFVPIVRTFAPFTAGVGAMAYSRFAAFNVLGAVVWVGGFVSAGWLLGTMPIVRNNLTLVMLGIIGASVLFPILGSLRKSWPQKIRSSIPTSDPAVLDDPEHAIVFPIRNE